MKRERERETKYAPVNVYKIEVEIREKTFFYHNTTNKIDKFTLKILLKP